MNRKMLITFCSTLCFIIQSCGGSEIESNFYSEETCSGKGFCVLEKECPGGLDDNLRSLCGVQKSKGAVCCPELKQENVNCYQLHHECRANCPTTLSLGGKGCPEGLTCCALI